MRPERAAGSRGRNERASAHIARARELVRDGETRRAAAHFGRAMAHCGFGTADHGPAAPGAPIERLDALPSNAIEIILLRALNGDSDDSVLSAVAGTSKGLASRVHSVVPSPLSKMAPGELRKISGYVHATHELGRLSA